MLSINNQHCYFIYGDGVDMRKGFNSLGGFVQSAFKMNPLSGDIFIFLSRTKTKIKLLQWQQDGFAIYYKRLEKGTFEQVAKMPASISLLSAQQLMLMMESIQLSSIKKRTRYHHSGVYKLVENNLNVSH